MDKKQIEVELQKVTAAIAAQEALRGTLPEAEITAMLAPLQQKKAELAGQLSGAVAQEAGAKAVGERGVLVEGAVHGHIVTGNQNQVGGIQANRIEAENVVHGMQQIGGEAKATAELITLAQALSQGSITADSIQAKNVVAGLQYIADPNHATPDQLRQEVAQLRRQLAEALAAAGEPPTADMTDAQEALDKAEQELEQTQPQGSRIIRKLKEAAELLTESAKTTDAARKTGQALIKLAPVAAALYQIATKLFAG